MIVELGRLRDAFPRVFPLAGLLPLCLSPFASIDLKAQTLEEVQDAVNESLQNISTNNSTSEVASVISQICPEGNFGLIKLTGTLQEDCNALAGASMKPPEQGEASVALTEITLDQARAPMNANFTSVGTQIANLAIRLSALRSGATGIGLGGLAINMRDETLAAEDFLGREDGGNGLNGGAASGDSIADFGRLGVFVTGTLTNGDQDATSNEAGFDFDTWGLTAGADYRFTDQFVLGAAVGYTNVDSNVKGKGGDLDLDGWGVAVYGTYYQSESFYLDGILSYGRNDFDQNRKVVYQFTDANVNQKFDADYDGNVFAAAIGAGYDFVFGGLTLAPEGRLRYVYADVDSYNEKASNPGSAGSGWWLHVDDQDYTSFTSSLGGRASYAWSLSWGVLLPLARVEWYHEFDPGNDDVKQRFIDDTSGTTILLPVDDDDENYFNLGLGLSAQFAKGRSAFVYYQKLLGYKDLDQDAVNLGLRFEF
jgi:outer membrane autotransporter protein